MHSGCWSYKLVEDRCILIELVHELTCDLQWDLSRLHGHFVITWNFMLLRTSLLTVIYYEVYREPWRHEVFHHSLNYLIFQIWTCSYIRLEVALLNTGITSLFPVQVAVWQETVGPGSFERDLCVNSPTGSGKTLSYALPIVQMLSTRAIKCLRALVVLPTRPLAEQVCSFALSVNVRQVILNP